MGSQASLNFSVTVRKKIRRDLRVVVIAHRDISLHVLTTRCPYWNPRRGRPSLVCGGTNSPQMFHVYPKCVARCFPTIPPLWAGARSGHETTGGGLSQRSTGGPRRLPVYTSRLATSSRPARWRHPWSRFPRTKAPMFSGSLLLNLSLNVVSRAPCACDCDFR